MVLMERQDNLLSGLILLIIKSTLFILNAKSMKKIESMKNKTFICFTIILLILTGCSDFLDVRPVGSVDKGTLSDKDGVDMLVTGMYASLLNNDYFHSTLSNWPYGDVMGGGANKGSTFNDQSHFTNLETYAITSDNEYLRGKWQSVYNGVFRANNVIATSVEIEDILTQTSGVEQDFFTEVVAQARFFRGMWHFEGVKVFGAAIPFIGSEEFAESVNPMVSNVDDSGNYIYIWDRIIDDLNFAYSNLPDVWSNDKGRINKWAAAALLAKVKMYQSSPYNGTNKTENHWSEVKTIIEDIMKNGKDNNGVKFKLADTYETLFTAGESDWTGESVFDIQLAISGTQTNTNLMYGSEHIGMSGALGTGGWGFFQPSYEMVNSYIVNDVGLPFLDKTYQKLEPLTVMVSNTPKTDLNVFVDPRLDISVGRFEVPYWDWSVPTNIDGWIRDVGNGGLYLNKKYTPKKADQGSLSVSTSTGSTAKNYHYIRYADVLLWYAEALIETGEFQKAGDYINQIRKRASNSYVKAVDPTTMEEAASNYIFEDLVNNDNHINAAGNYRINLYPSSQFSTKESALEALRFERKLEFALEGQLWFDLSRWGIVHDVLNNYIEYEKNHLVKFQSSTYNKNWVTLPIPESEIITMEGVLVQNENWK